MDSTSAIAPANAQHMQALARANRVRLARAALKRTIAAGGSDAADVIVESPWEAESMTVSELLMSQRRWGRTRCRKFLTSVGLNENKQIGTMTERQRLILASALRAKVAATRSRSRSIEPAEAQTVLAA